MRFGVLAATVICAIAATGGARAQSGASTILGGAAPSSIQFKPIDMSSVVATPTFTTQKFEFQLLHLIAPILHSGLAGQTRD